MNNRRLIVSTSIALLCNALIYFIGSIAGATWKVSLPFTVSLPMVIGATVLPMLLGAQIVTLLSKWRPSMTRLSAWLVLAFSVAGSPSGWIASNNPSTGISLGAMHVVVGIAWFNSIYPRKI